MTPWSAKTEIKETATSNGEASNVLVCVDDDESWKGSVRHAIAVASSFGGSVVLIKVFEPPNGRVNPLDPVDWEIRKRSVRTDLENFAKDHASPECAVTLETLEGDLVDQLCACATRHAGGIVVVRGPGVENGWTERSRINRLVDLDVGSVLMIPADAGSAEPPRFKRILVPLDGSKLGETALPAAVAVARAHDAEIFLCHITPDPATTFVGPPDEDTVALQERIRQRNRETGKDYLKRMAGRLKSSGVPVSVLLIEGGDARRSLLEAARGHAADLLVMASHGQSGHPDVPTGHVTGFILDHATIPVLMVRKQHQTERKHTHSGVRSRGVRVPAKTNNG